MKKVFALLLTLALIATLSVVSFAAEPSANPADGNADKSLNVAFDDVAPSQEIVYSMDISWNDDLIFDYNAGTQGAWNPAEHQYGPVEGADWEDKDLKVTVTNRSNAKVDATLTIYDAGANDGLTVTVDDDTTKTATLDSAVGATPETVPTVDFEMIIEGTPTASVDKVATATVSIKATQNA